MSAHRLRPASVQSRLPSYARLKRTLYALMALLGIAAASALVGPLQALTMAFLLGVAGSVVVVALARPLYLLLGATFISVALPVYFAPGPGFLLAFRVVALLALGFWFVSYLLEDNRQPRPGLIDGLIAAYLAWFVGSGVLWGPGVPKIILIDAIIPFSVYLASRGLKPTERQAIRWALLAGCFVGALTVLYEMFVTHGPTFRDASTYRWRESSNEIFRPGGVYGGPPQAATVLGLGLCACAPLYSNQLGWRRWVARVAAATILLAALTTFTRAPLIGLGIALLLLLTVPVGFTRAANRAVVIAGAVIVTVIAVLPTLSNSTVFQQGVVRPGQLAARESYWVDAIPIITANLNSLLIGHGAGLIMSIRNNQITAVPLDFASVPLITGIGVHSTYVMTALELGLIGLVGLAGILLGTVISALREAVRSTAHQRRLELTALAGSVTVVIAAMFASELSAPVVFGPLALALGLTRATLADRDG